MDPHTWRSLEKLFEEFPFMHAEPVPSLEIAAAESLLGLEFDPSYKAFVQKYGGAIVGPYPIYGLRQAEPMDSELWSVDVVTLRFRKEGWPKTENWYVISSDHSGNPIGITQNGHVKMFDHDAGQVVEVAGSFEEYLKKCLAG